jgi:hypothetical protein
MDTPLAWNIYSMTNTQHLVALTATTRGMLQKITALAGVQMQQHSSRISCRDRLIVQCTMQRHPGVALQQQLMLGNGTDAAG